MYNTNQKRKLIDIFQCNKEQSFSSTYLVEALSSEMNKTTVYRQLKTLEEDQVIRKNYNEKTKSYEYQYVEDCSNHLHLKCNRCGRVTHLKCEEANTFISHILKHHGFLINQLSSTLTGMCKECLEICSM